MRTRWLIALAVSAPVVLFANNKLALKVGYKAWSGRDCHALITHNRGLCDSHDCAALIDQPRAV